MKQNVDFLFRYEHKVRELETISLLRIELERRGYSVAFVGNYEYNEKIEYQPKVFISPAIYSNAHLKGDILRYGKMKKVANLLWEQVFTQDNEVDPNFPQNVVGLGARALNLCWGEQSRNRIVKGGANPESSVVVGQVNQDLLKGDFKKALKSKELLAETYGLDYSKHWQLFVSSFAFCDMDQLQVDLIIKFYGESYYNYFKTYSDNCRDTILDWFESILPQKTNTLIIYRPHPDEAAKSERLKSMQKKYDNFYVISELAIKHWINACDKTLNWYSTGIIDGIILNKPWRLLRPFPLDKGMDYRIMYEAEKIQCFEQFAKDFDDYSCKTIVDECLVQSYYYIQKEGFIYKKVCDLLEELYKTDKYDINYTLKESVVLDYHILRSRILRFVKMMSSALFSDKIVEKLIDLFMKRRRLIKVVLAEGYEKNVVNEDDLKDMYNRLAPIVYGQ